ncbi:MAG: Crp/Fnr family transcriptional regulator [Oscillospiraceae bacterium]|nr:Crp/Fnr family transcriptional regulator [Oscillospiraceae bacterium]
MISEYTGAWSANWKSSSDRVISKLENNSTLVEFRKGDRLLFCGDPVTDVYLLLTGALKQVYCPEEGVAVVNTLHCTPRDGVIPLDFDLFEARKSRGEIVALKKGTALKISIQTLRKLMEDDPAIAEGIIHELNLYRRWFVDFHYAKSRYHNNLKELLEWLIINAPQLFEYAGLEDLASLLGVSYYHLSRVRCELKREKPELFPKKK